MPKERTRTRDNSKECIVGSAVSIPQAAGVRLWAAWSTVESTGWKTLEDSTTTLAGSTTVLVVSGKLISWTKLDLFISHASPPSRNVHGRPWTLPLKHSAEWGSGSHSPLSPTSNLHQRRVSIESLLKKNECWQFPMSGDSSKHWHLWATLQWSSLDGETCRSCGQWNKCKCKRHVKLQRRCWCQGNAWNTMCC